VVTPNTLLLNIERDYNLFKNKFDGRDFSLSLVYRGSEQGFTYKEFWKLVGGKQPTLHVVKNEHDYIIGGCAFEQWLTGDWVRKRDEKAFLF
jgi:hypothetical protein